MSEDEIGSPLYNPKGEGCARYALAAIATILGTPALLGIFMAFVVSDPSAFLAFMLFGAIIATPIVLIGAALHMILSRQVHLRWWHSALAGLLLMLITIVILLSPTNPASAEGYWAVAIFLGVGFIGGLIFHYFVTLQKPDAKTNND